VTALAHRRSATVTPLRPLRDATVPGLDLAEAYLTIRQVEAVLAAEVEWQRRLKVVAALTPYALRPHVRGSLEEWTVLRARLDHASRCPAMSPSTCRCATGPNRRLTRWRAGAR
jgi:hypothetical protein